MIQDTVATKACVECHARRRKCNRSLPSCSLCNRLGRSCHYEASTRSYALPRETSVAVSERSSVVGTLTPSEEGGLRLDLDLDLDIGRMSQGTMDVSVCQAITDQLLRAIESGDAKGIPALEALAVRFFRTVHLWFPIVSEEALYRRLPGTYARPRADFSLLLLSMALINWVPLDGEEPLPALYAIVKTSIALTEAAGVCSLETVQARLLVALFEIGHGLDNQADVSLGAVERAAGVLGINSAAVGGGVSVDVCQDGLRVWWAIVILERFNCLVLGGRRVGEGFAPPNSLPKDRKFLDQNMLTSEQPLPLSTPSSLKIGPFARQAQVSHILQILLLHLKGKETDVEESDQLVRTLTAFSFLLPEERTNAWPQYCGALGLCYSALMTLHVSRSAFAPRADHAPESVQFSLDRMTNFATSFNSKVCQVDMEGISPFAPLGIRIAAGFQWKGWMERGDERCLESADQLGRMLCTFKRRWRCATKYDESLGRERGMVGVMCSGF